jgi:hypothetical protein
MLLLHGVLGKGLKPVAGAAPTGPVWQRGPTHYAENLVARVLRVPDGMTVALVRTILERPDYGTVWARTRVFSSALSARSTCPQRPP